MIENGGNLDWACANCPKTRQADLHPYTSKLTHLYALQMAGYPLQADDLTLEEWLDLGRVRQTLDPPTHCPMQPRSP